MWQDGSHPYSGIGRQKYNDNSADVEVVTDVTTEPVTLDQVKRHLNLEFDTAGSFDFTDDDTYLNELNAQCREAAEQETGLSLAPKTLRVIVRNELGNVEIPFGPIASVTSISDWQGNLIDPADYKLMGNLFKTIAWPCFQYLDIIYEAGYAAGKCPKGIIRGILEEIAYRYNLRGDAEVTRADITPGVCEGARNKLAPYKRKGFIA